MLTGQTTDSISYLKTVILGVPGSSGVKSLPASAGDTGSIPGPGKSHMLRSSWARAPQLLNLSSRAHESQLLKPTRLEPVLHDEKPPQWEARTATKTQHSQKQTNKNEQMNKTQ